MSDHLKGWGLPPMEDWDDEQLELMMECMAISDDEEERERNKPALKAMWLEFGRRLGVYSLQP